MERKSNCFICGRSPVDEHHILTKKSHPEYKHSPFNLIYLCRAHHNEIHYLGRSSFIRKFGMESEMLNRGFELVMGKWVYTVKE